MNIIKKKKNHTREKIKNKTFKTIPQQLTVNDIYYLPIKFGQKKLKKIEQKNRLNNTQTHKKANNCYQQTIWFFSTFV